MPPAAAVPPVPIPVPVVQQVPIVAPVAVKRSAFPKSPKSADSTPHVRLNKHAMLRDAKSATPIYTDGEHPRRPPTVAERAARTASTSSQGSGCGTPRTSRRSSASVSTPTTPCNKGGKPTPKKKTK